MALSILENREGMSIRSFRFFSRKCWFGLYLSCYPFKDAGRQNESVSSPISGISLNSSKYITALEEGKKIAGSKKRSSTWEEKGSPIERDRDLAAEWWGQSSGNTELREKWNFEERGEEETSSHDSEARIRKRQHQRIRVSSDLQSVKLYSVGLCRI